MASESPLVPTGAISQADMEAARAAAIEVMKVANKKAEEPLVNPHKKTFTEAIDSLQTDSIERIQFLLVFGGLLGFISGAHTGKLECDAIYGDQLKAVQTAADKRRLLRDYFYEVRRNGTANGTKYSIKYAIYIGGYSVTEIISRKIWQDRESMVSHLVAGSVLGSSIGLTGGLRTTGYGMMLGLLTSSAYGLYALVEKLHSPEVIKLPPPSPSSSSSSSSSSHEALVVSDQAPSSS